MDLFFRGLVLNFIVFVVLELGRNRGGFVCGDFVWKGRKGLGLI